MLQFSYSFLVWRTLNNKLNKLPERALRLAYDDRQSKFEELLNIDKSVTIHHRNLQVLAAELYKVHHGLAPELMNDIFKKGNVTHNFRKSSTSETRNIKSVYYGSETISFIGPKIWELLPSSIKDSENLNIFKSNIKSWKSENCPCRLCRLYIADIGFFVSLCVRLCTFVVRLCACNYVVVSVVYMCVCVLACAYTLMRMCVYVYMQLCVRLCISF